MSLKDLFLIFRKNDDQNMLKKKLTALEAEVKELKQTLSEIHDKKIVIPQKEPPILIERVNIEKIILDKYELNNNFGQLGIKELKGKLNIGATYGSDFIPMEDEEKTEEKKDEPKQPLREQGPKVNIHPKKSKQ